VFYHGASGGKHVLSAMLFDLLPGVIGAMRALPLGKFFHKGILVSQNAGPRNILVKGH
jgi:hypothetical protein